MLVLSQREDAIISIPVLVCVIKESILKFLAAIKDHAIAPAAVSSAKDSKAKISRLLKEQYL